MRTPRRYRLALLAYPAGYRAARAPEFLATLAEGDEERGRPSAREAAALMRRGVAMRLRAHGPGDWLLAAAAALVLVAAVGVFSWAERTFAFNGAYAGWMSDGPGVWWSLALGLIAYIALAAIFFGALERPRRRRIAVAAAAPFALLCFPMHGRAFQSGVPAPDVLLDQIVWLGEASFANWEITVPMMLAAVAASWVALYALARLGPGSRSRVLSAALLLPAVVALAQAWQRPDGPGITNATDAAVYAQSAFADLGPAAFLTALAIPLALAGALSTGRGSGSHP